MQDTMVGFTPEDEKNVIEALSRWQGGGLSDELFTALARITPQAVVEVCVMREREGVIETLLLPRPENDPVWPGMVHSPGSVFRNADFQSDDHSALNVVFERIRGREIKAEFSAVPEYVGTIYCVGDRGAEVSQVFLTELAADSPLSSEATWCPVDRLSENPNFIMHQLPHHKMAAEYYRLKLNSMR